MDADLVAVALTMINLSQVGALTFISRRTAQVRQEIFAVLEWLTDPTNAPTQERGRPRP